jgi:hypothetical protein
VFAPVAYSGTDGVARQRWTLGTRSGTQRLVARALDPETGAVLVDDTVTATGMPDVAGAVIPHRPASNALPIGDSTWVWIEYRDAFGNQNPPCADGGAKDRPELAQWITTDATEVVVRGGMVRNGEVGTWVVAVGPTDDFNGDLVSISVEVATVRAAGGGCLADRWADDHYLLEAGWSFNTRP